MKRQALSYTKFEKMITERAWAWYHTTGIPVDDFISLGSEVYVRCVLKFDPKKGTKFGTYLHTSLNHRFADWSKKASRLTEMSDEMLDSIPDHRYSGKRIRESLAQTSADAQWLAEQIIWGTAPIRSRKDGSVSSKLSRGTIRDWLNRQYGWGHERVYDAFREISAAL